MSQRLIFALVAGTVFVCFASTAYAADIHVPGDYASIQAAIDAATAGDTVIVTDGTYTGAGNVNLDFGGKAITVRSENGATNCIIDCQNIDSTRGFYFHSNEGNSSILDGFTITNGNIPSFALPTMWNWGGGILCTDGASPTIRNCIITTCFTSNFGGAIYCRVGSSPIIEDCVMNGNSTLSGGGAIGCYDNSNPTIRNCTITNNQATSTDQEYGYGGAITIKENCAPIIENCTISNNTARSNGGGIYMETNISATVTGCTITGNQTADTGDYGRGGGIAVATNSSPIIENCTITGNTASTLGGGILFIGGSSAQVTNCIITANSSNVGGGAYFYGSNDTITNCFIDNNTANVNGGGIYLFESSAPTITNCTITGNTVSGGGGGGVRINNGSTPTLTNCTISGNNASVQGGGIRCMDNSWGTFNNCIIWGNSSADGYEIYTDDATSTITLNYCNYADETLDTKNVEGLGTVTPNSCLKDDPLFMGSGDYHLQDTSPCIDTGLDSYVSSVTEDLDGNARILGAAVDMGPYEANVDSPMVSVTTPASPSGSPVIITYDVSDPQDDTVTVSFDYSVDGGTTWASATAASGDSNPQASITTPASGLTFTWDADADLTSQIEDAMVRVTADDGNGHTGKDTTAEFTVIDLQPPANFTGVGTAIDQIEWSWTDAVGPNAYLLEDASSNRIAIIASGQESYTETVSGENTPATRLLRSSASSTTQLTVEPAGTATGASLPWYVDGYHAQFLYTAAELSNTEGSIKKIYWQRSITGGTATYTDVSVTVGHSTKTVLDANCDSNFDVDGSTVVRDAADYVLPPGSVDKEWLEIPLNRSFYYDGTNNLVIDIDVASGTDSIGWTKVDTLTGTSLYANPGSSNGTPWEKKFFLKLEVETINAMSDPATASAFTLVHDAAVDDFTVELAVSGQEVEITITAPPNPSAGLTGAKIERATNDTFTLNATTVQNFTDQYTFTDTDVTGGDTYYYRITFCNGDGIASAESAGESVTVLGPNSPPVAIITAPTSGSHTGDIPISYNLRDYDGDTAQIIVEYSTDGGSNWITATIGSGGDLTTPLSTSLAGDAHTYVWDSLTDDVGTSVAEPAQLRITPIDKDGTGTEDTTSFIVSNIAQEPPVITITDPTTGSYNGDITITYTLTDENIDNCDITVEYSKDSGASWDPCYSGAGGDGVTGLASSAAGVTHTFVWASETDMPNVFDNISLRVIADDGNSATGGGTGFDTVDFDVDNGAVITAHLSGSPVAGNAPLTVQFTDMSVGNVTSWLWTFGDGATSTNQNPSHQYTIIGAFNVSLTVTGPSGTDTETRDNYISVVASPAAAPKKKSDGCGCRVDRMPTPLNELFGYFLPLMLFACTYLALRRRNSS